MGRSYKPMHARNRKSMGSGPDYPFRQRKPVDVRLTETDFVDALCDTVVPLLASRNAPARKTFSDPEIERGSDPLQACRVEEFVQLLLDEDDNGCEDFAFRQAASGADPQRMASDYLGPAARLLGDYWRMDICDFIQVTVCMTRIQRLFWRLVDECPPACEAKAGFSILMAPVPGEQHSFGQSVVEDAFRRQGWQVDSCSFDEADDLHLLAGSNEYPVIALTISGEEFLPIMAATIIRLRRQSRNRAVSIMAGGGLFLSQPDVADIVDADLVALDVGQALVLAEAVVAASGGSRHIASA